MCCCAIKKYPQINGFGETELPTDHVFYRKQKVTETEGRDEEPLVLWDPACFSTTYLVKGPGVRR